jgi:hypothetical protein
MKVRRLQLTTPEYRSIRRKDYGALRCSIAFLYKVSFMPPTAVGLATRHKTIALLD